MAKILVLASTGSGKTTSYCGREKLGIKGLDPKDTYVIQCINRALPGKKFKLTKSLDIKDLPTGNLVQVSGVTGLDRFRKVAEVIKHLSDAKCPVKNIVVDDLNYLMQDYYLANAMKGGWDTAKEIGYGMDLVFQPIKNFPENKNIIFCAHFEEYKDKIGDSLSYRMKSTGKMVDGHITPEGHFDLILYIKQEFDHQSKESKREFVYEFDGTFPAKDTVGFLDNFEGSIKNDLSIIIDAINEYYK